MIENMTRTIPGTADVEGREFLYVETADGQEFQHFVGEACASCVDTPMPRSGGVIEEKARVLLHDGSSLLAISYKGDLSAWRNKFTAYCESKGRKWGIASNQKLTLSDGTQIDLSQSNVTFEE